MELIEARGQSERVRPTCRDAVAQDYSDPLRGDGCVQLLEPSGQAERDVGRAVAPKRQDVVDDVFELAFLSLLLDHDGIARERHHRVVVR